jgi:hypothetical protein
MFCPNCGANNGAEQNFCRGCGLKFDAIVEQFPSKEYTELQRRTERLQRIGVACFDDRRDHRLFHAFIPDGVQTPRPDTPEPAE